MNLTRWGFKKKCEEGNKQKGWEWKIINVNHRIIEYPELERAHQGNWSPNPAPANDPLKNHTICLRALFKCFLNSGRLSVMTTSLGSLFQSPANLWVKNLFLIPSLNLPWHSFMPIWKIKSLRAAIFITVFTTTTTKKWMSWEKVTYITLECKFLTRQQ